MIGLRSGIETEPGDVWVLCITYLMQVLCSSVMWDHVTFYKGTNVWQKPSVCRWHEVLPKTWHFHFHMESVCFFEEFGIRLPEYVVEY